MAKQSRSRVQKKARKAKEQARRARQEAERRQRLIDDMNTFLNMESDFESFEDFEDAQDNPFDAETKRKQFNTQQEAVEDMQTRYKDWKERSRDTFNRRKHTTNEQREKIVQVLGSDIYQLFKERFNYDSDQFIDLVKGFDLDVDEIDIEASLNQLWNDIADNKAWTFNTRAIEEALNLGFSLDEAIELTYMDRIHTKVFDKNVNAIISDYLTAVAKDLLNISKEQENVRRRYQEKMNKRRV